MSKQERMDRPAGMRGVSRRDLLKVGAAAAAGAAVGPFIITPARAQSFNWQRFRGTELFLILTRHPWIDEMVTHIPEFESLSGMKVNYEMLPEIQGRQKLTVELTAGTGGVDAFHTALHVEKRRFWKAGWYQPLNRFLEDKTLTAPDYDWDDFVAGAKEAVTQPDHTISAIPTMVDFFALFYRKDLFQQKGWKAPRTLAEMEDYAQKLTTPPGMYGIVARGLKNANAAAIACILYAMGGTYLTPDGRSALNTRAWVKAVDYYATLLRQFAPPGVLNFNWYECSSAFMQGNVGMYFDGINFANQFEDREKSKIAGKVGYAVLPAGPGGHIVPTFTNGMAITAHSRRKEAAYLFIQWSTDKQNAARELLSGVGVGRGSTWNLPEIKAKRKMPADWYATYSESLKIARPGLPEIMDVTQYRDIIGVAIQKAIEGAKAEEVMAQADKEFQALLDKTER